MTFWRTLGWLLVIAGALALRLPHLDQRPMHNDEAVNADKLKGLWETGKYQYDPHEYHGPSLYYTTLPFLWASPARSFAQVNERTLRLAPVCFGAGVIVLLLLLLRDGLGAPATFFAGVLMALSPAMVFYSRYFIHEMPLVFFTMLVLAAGWRYTRTRQRGWAMVAGTGLGLMYATKETFVIAVGAMALAAGVAVIWERRRETLVVPDQPYWNFKHVVALVAPAAVVSMALFTSFFTHPAGPLDSLRTYLPWLDRAAGNSPHIHPWYFYFERLAWFHPGKGPVWSEGLILLLALIGFIAALANKGLADTHVGFARFVALYTLILTAAYCAIGYKTPWCMLGFLSGMILLAGLGAVALIRFMRAPPLQLMAGLALMVAAAHLGRQAWRASQAWRPSQEVVADRQNPYVYSQTSPNILELVEQVKAIARVSPDGNKTPIQVMAPGGDYWPLPWYLREFKRVGFWNQLAPTNQYTPLMIVGRQFQADLDEKTDKAWLMPGLFELRTGVFFELYAQFDLWKKYVEAKNKAEGGRQNGETK